MPHDWTLSPTLAAAVALYDHGWDGKLPVFIKDDEAFPRYLPQFVAPTIDPGIVLRKISTSSQPADASK